MSNCVYAYTESNNGHMYPGFINVSKNSNGAGIVITIRSKSIKNDEVGEVIGGQSYIELGWSEIAELNHELNRLIAAFTSNA